MQVTDQLQATSEAALLRTPFDQYGRYRLVQEAVTAARPALDRERLRILDVGGYYQQPDGTPAPPAFRFLADHAVTVVDLPACDLPGYVQGDGTSLTFADADFDLVISCDTLEHIPPPQRRGFINELVRVARYGVLLICPTYDYVTALGEQVLDAYIWQELQTKHPALLEHLEYGLPDLPMISETMRAAGCDYREYPSGYVFTWLPMMFVKHYLERYANDSPLLHYGLDELYNRSFARADRREPGYRQLVVAAKDNAGNWLEAVDRALEPTVTRGADVRLEDWHGLAAQVLWLFQFGPNRRRQDEVLQMLNQYIEGQRQHVSNLDRIIADQQMHIQQLGQQIQHLANLNQMLHLQLEDREARSRWQVEQIADLEGRAQWLAEQADAARAQLSAIEQGRILRLLRRLRGK